MSDIAERVRGRAYELWQQAGRPEGRSDEFWFAAEHELEGETAMGDEEEGTLVPPAEEPLAAAFQHGAPTDVPGERIAEQGAIDDQLEELVFPSAAKSATE
jgi:hypothetical protein